MKERPSEFRDPFPERRVGGRFTARDSEAAAEPRGSTRRRGHSRLSWRRLPIFEAGTALVEHLLVMRVGPRHGRAPGRRSRHGRRPVQHRLFPTPRPLRQRQQDEKPQADAASIYDVSGRPADGPSVQQSFAFSAQHVLVSRRDRQEAGSATVQPRVCPKRRPWRRLASDSRRHSPNGPLRPDRRLPGPRRAARRTDASAPAVRARARHRRPPRS